MNKTEKILPFEIELDEAKKRLEKYITNSTYENRERIVNALKPVYLPYWMYDGTCDAEYEYFTFGKHSRHYLEDIKLECKGILVNATTKMEDSLVTQLEQYFDLSKLKVVDTSYVNDVCLEACDITLYKACSKFNKKLQHEVFEEGFGLPAKCDYKDININKNPQYTHIQLPFYYAEVDELKVLVSGQTGDIATNAKEYLKSKKDLFLKKGLYINQINSSSSTLERLKAALEVLFIMFVIAVTSGVLSVWGNEMLGTFIPLLFFIMFFLYYQSKKYRKRCRYVKNVIYKKRKRLSLSDLVVRKNNKKREIIVQDSNFIIAIELIIGLVIGIAILVFAIYSIKLILLNNKEIVSIILGIICFAIVLSLFISEVLPVIKRAKVTLIDRIKSEDHN